MNAAEAIAFGAAIAGAGVLISQAVGLAKARADSNDRRRAFEAYQRVMLPRILGRHLHGVADGEAMASAAADMDIADLALLHRFSFVHGYQKLVNPRRDEVEAWLKARRRQPWSRLAAFLRSAVHG